jgi:peptidoglycan/LPS O-acetylase OafA/YrhL
VGIIRFLLAMSVVLGHGVGYVWLIPLNGGAAVYCFFIVSGFYMTMIINNNKYSFQGGIIVFYANRLLRLYPAYLFILLAVLLYRLGSNPAKYYALFDSINEPLRIQTLFANISFIGMDHLRSAWRDAGLLETRIIAQAWSLEPEILFYAIAPIFLSKISFSRATVLFIFASAMFYFRDELLQLGAWVLIPKYLVFFILGTLSYLIFSQINTTKEINKAPVIAAALGIGLLFYGYLMKLDQVSNAIDVTNFPIYAGMVILMPFAWVLSRFDVASCGKLMTTILRIFLPKLIPTCICKM